MESIRDREQAAADKVRSELAKPLPQDEDELGAEGTFDPWALFPSLYGTYSQAFDDMALLVLRNLQLAAEGRWDEQNRAEELAHEMFREMLCNSELCDYGSSPRVCFATEPFKSVLPDLIAKWEAFSHIHWAEPAAR